MTEPTPEAELPPAPGPAVPELTLLEHVARLAAENVVRELPENPEPRLAAVEESVQQILQALTAAAGPDGNAARLAARLETVERDLAALADKPPQPHPEQQQTIDELRLKVAQLTYERTKP